MLFTVIAEQLTQEWLDAEDEDARGKDRQFARSDPSRALDQDGEIGPWNLSCV